MSQFLRSLAGLTLMVILVAPSSVFAHNGLEPHNGWLHGFLHPLSGLDHLLAMLAVGLWAAQFKDRLIWLIPLIFVAVMGLGGLLGFLTLPIAVAEFGILLSLLVLGMLIALHIQLSVSSSAVLIALFALSHGYAHGTEIPPMVSMFSYAGGFMLATLFLHLSGIGLAVMFKNSGKIHWMRFSGIMMTCYGGFLIIQSMQALHA